MSDPTTQRIPGWDQTNMDEECFSTSVVADILKVEPTTLARWARLVKLPVNCDPVSVVNFHTRRLVHYEWPASHVKRLQDLLLFSDAVIGKPGVSRLKQKVESQFAVQAQPIHDKLNLTRRNLRIKYQGHVHNFRVHRINGWWTLGPDRRDFVDKGLLVAVETKANKVPYTMTAADYEESSDAR